MIISNFFSTSFSKWFKATKKDTKEAFSVQTISKELWKKNEESYFVEWLVQPCQYILPFHEVYMNDEKVRRRNSCLTFTDFLGSYSPWMG